MLLDPKRSSPRAPQTDFACRREGSFEKGRDPGRNAALSDGDVGGVWLVEFLGAPNRDTGLDFGLGPHGFSPSHLQRDD